MAENRKPPLALRASVVALHGALALFASGAWAQAPAAPASPAPAAAPSGPAFDDPAVQELVKPVNTIEAGVIGVDSPSHKFGEYNGLHREGARPLLDFEVRGGGAYQPETGSTERWRVYGSRLGLPVRELGAEYSQQGSWRIGFDYDELLRNFADDYLTIYRGAGTTTLTLPPGYVGANNVQTPATAAAINRSVVGHQLETQRRRLGVSGEVILSPLWSFSAGARQEKKDGTKLTGVAFGSVRGTFLPEPVDYETYIVEAAVRYHRKDAHFTLGYNASFFNNGTDLWTAQNPFATGAVFQNRASLSGAPDNTMHQLTADGGWRFTPATRLTLSAAYARMKQNEPYFYNPADPNIQTNGAASADARQDQTNFLARLNHRVFPGLDLAAAYRFEHRDTKTPIGLYAFQGADSTSALTPTRIVNNLPQNRRQQTFSFDGSYNLRPGATMTAGLEHLRLRRSIDPPGRALTTQENPFLSGEANQNTLRLGYRQAVNERLNGQISLAHSRREGEDYIEPRPVTAAPPPGNFTLLPGFRQFFLASRNQDKVRASADYQLTEAFTLQGSFEYQRDRYPDSRYGLRKSDMQTWTIDGTYAASETLSFNGFFTFEDGETHSDHYHLPSGGTPLGYAVNPACPTPAVAGTASNVSDPCRNWSVNQGDRVFTVGFGTRAGGLMKGKVTLTADLSHSRAHTHLNFAGGTYSSATAGARFQSTLHMPLIVSDMTDLRLGLLYNLNKESGLRLGYLHRRLRSSDPQFDLWGLTTSQSFIGPGMTAPNYKVHAVSVSYVYTFR